MAGDRAVLVTVASQLEAGPVCYDGACVKGATEHIISKHRETRVPIKTASELDNLTLGYYSRPARARAMPGESRRHWYPPIWPAMILTESNIFLDTSTTSTLGN